MPGSKRFLLVPNLSRHPLIRPFLNRKTDPDGHGTCMASKATGAFYGVAKNADLVIVKYSRLLIGDILTGLAMIQDDIVQNKLQGKAVINLSLNCQYH